MSDTIEKFDLKSHAIAEDKQRELLRLFPEVRTEGGKIDFDRLKRVLGETVDAGKERYGMNWPGKADCFKTLQAPSMATLRPCPEESVNFDTTKNMIIEGDNLEVLKLLQKSYLGKVKMIYIDPPYNTGNDFVYPDNYSESLQTYLEYTGQVDGEGKKFGTNADTDGRFHSKWMNMMYPRLFLARNLLKENGLIFISIDDCEYDNLKKICDEIYGEENFVASIAWEKRYTRSNNARMFYSLKDFVLLYRKSDMVSNLKEARSEESGAIYSNPDGDSRGVWTSSSYVNPATKDKRPNLVYSIANPTTNQLIEHPTHAWKYGMDEHLKHVAEKRLWWGQDGLAKFPRLKNFLAEMDDGMVPVDLWKHELTGTTDEGGLQLKELFSEAVFENPKPTKLIKRAIQLSTVSDSNDIILDFFAGSGTSGQAVIEQNKKDGGNRNFILVQLPEPIESNSFSSIAEITKERIRRTSQRLNGQGNDGSNSETPQSQDRGFRVFKLSSSNFKSWDSEVSHEAALLTNQLELHIDHIRPDRSQLDLLYELLLKSGYPLTAPVEKINLAGKDVFSVQAGALFICLESNLTLDLIRAMADKQPERVVCLDVGFAGNDQLKANAVLIFKSKGVARFQTV